LNEWLTFAILPFYLRSLDGRFIAQDDRKKGSASVLVEVWIRCVGQKRLLASMLDRLELNQRIIGSVMVKAVDLTALTSMN
jgi:hypothetical protein